MRHRRFYNWVYTFYIDQYSRHPIVPYANTDGDGFLLGGDPFRVYHGESGVPQGAEYVLGVRERLNNEIMDAVGRACKGC